MLLSLQESPLEFELVPVGGRKFTHFFLDCAEFVGCYAELFIFDDVESVDTGRRARETDLDDYLFLELALEADEELSTIVEAQVLNFGKICLANWCKVSKQIGGSLHV